MTETRDNQTATRLYNGKVLMAGGQGGPGVQVNAELYEPGTGTFVATGSTSTVIIYTATLLHDGKVLLAGANRNNGDPANAEL